MPITALIWTSLIVTLVYAIWILALLRGWIKLDKITVASPAKQPKVSLIVAFRNEEEHLPALLASIALQRYPNKFVELILVDDHSGDRSQQVIQEFTIKNPYFSIKLLQLPLDQNGKKAALQLAYQKANNPIILCTDADCMLPNNWLQISVNAFHHHQTQMILGGVKIANSKGFLQYFQSLELLSLIGSGAGAKGLGQVMMSNGANIGFRREILKKIETERLKPETPSGDDLFLTSEVKRIYGQKAIHFIKNAEHFVSTYAEEKFSDLINQRVRWVSKSSNYTDAFLLSTSIIVLLENLMLPVLLLTSFFFSPLWPFLLLFWLVKSLVDFLFLYHISHFVSQKQLLKAFSLMAILYPFFISYTAIVGQFASFQWKDRKYS